jgi:NAD(P)-dependent dehydrogenase (short-subunit alcohol dehydrogenase family)
MSLPTHPILVTGGNKGIGLEICRQLARLRYRVILSARSAEKGQAAVNDLAREGLEVGFLRLDVSDEASIGEAARELARRHSALHALINNAAIAPRRLGTILEAGAAEIRDTFITNTLGPILLTQALLPLLEAGAPSRVINVSSRLGSVHHMTDGWAAYGISKAALNAATRKLAPALVERGISVNAASPGWARTEMGGQEAPLSVEHGARNIVRLFTDFPPDVTNRFLEEKGEIAW